MKHATIPGRAITRNGMPGFRPYVYRGKQPYTGPEPDRAEAARKNGGWVSRDLASAAYRARLAEYARLRAEGTGIKAAAEAVGVTARTARRRYEPELAGMLPETPRGDEAG